MKSSYSHAAPETTKYPYLGIVEDKTVTFIVLFYDENAGICVGSSDSKRVGEYNSWWVAPTGVFKGQVILEND